MAATVDANRLAQITKLYGGFHQPNDLGTACVMEAVAYVAGEPWSDHPECVCPVLGAFMRMWNDALDDDTRSRLLLPLVPQLVGTHGGRSLEERRAFMAIDWLVRVHMPTWLRLAGFSDHADALAALPEITSDDQFDASQPMIRAAWKAIGGPAVWDEDCTAAETITGAAAGASAGVPAETAARFAIRTDALYSPVEAALAAARGAAGDEANRVVSELQLSAIALVERMIAATDPEAA